MNKLLQIINSGEYEKIEGWCTKEKAIKMAELITDDTKLCVELGVFGGRSLLPLGIMCKGDVVGIDAWKVESSLTGINDKTNDEWWAKIDYNKMKNYTHNLMKKYNCNNVKLIQMESSEAIKFFADESISFLHQDSNHSEKISCVEVELYHKKVKKNGIWVFDDTNWETTKKAQELLVSYDYIEIYDSGTWKIYKRL